MKYLKQSDTWQAPKNPQARMILLKDKPDHVLPYYVQNSLKGKGGGGRAGRPALLRPPITQGLKFKSLTTASIVQQEPARPTSPASFPATLPPFLTTMAP